ncbi:hypothetical protein MAR_000737 [Mya arenaria]|uniref:Uncharacterized protein n=1 Tax=Mya arenaria TaxID=6604 RepID=A0ABY7FC03_MYAAR|nr:hypothetical protein MAR_000737 [Mya arenaria]
MPRGKSRKIVDCDLPVVKTMVFADLETANIYEEETAYLSEVDTTLLFFVFHETADILAVLEISDFYSFKLQMRILIRMLSILVTLYGGLPVEGLDLLRFRKYTTKFMSSSSQVQVHSLPPTSAAADA